MNLEPVKEKDGESLRRPIYPRKTRVGSSDSCFVAVKPKKLEIKLQADAGSTWSSHSIAIGKMSKLVYLVGQVGDLAEQLGGIGQVVESRHVENSALADL